MHSVKVAATRPDLWIATNPCFISFDKAIVVPKIKAPVTAISKTLRVLIGENRNPLALIVNFAI